MRNKGEFAAIEGVTIGHWTDLDAATGCTVVLVLEGAVASVDARGGAPATRETDLLRPGNLVDSVHAVVLAGGSAFGLDAATGVVRWLEERGHGFPVRTGVVPIVPAAALIDLGTGRADVRPDAAAGYAACAASSPGPPAEGCVGAGTGATVAKALGPERMLKGGFGGATEELASGVRVTAVVAVNAWGEIVDPGDGSVVAGPRGEGSGFVSTLGALREGSPLSPFAGENSTIGVVITDAVLSKEDCLRVATMAHTGLARTIRPVHTPVDGDVIFALATGRSGGKADVMQVGALAALAVERAVLRAVRLATGLAGVPAAADWDSASLPR
ncbi:MAG TPA: P1 family peptidase [Dehalococcoidia bacterium]|nr:P1 family peptidase [Dehalococcoidia bacterium]